MWDALAQTVIYEGRHGSRDTKGASHVKEKRSEMCRVFFANVNCVITCISYENL